MQQPVEVIEQEAEASLVVPASTIHASQAFAKASNAMATWQVLSTLAVFFGLLGASPYLGKFAPLVILPLGGTLVRIFIFQHDCGHQSMFSTRKLNDGVGLGLSFLLGVPYHAWRVEHNWHHAHQGKLTRRGVDSNNSPMTLAEARDDHRKASLISRFVSPITVFASGVWSLVVMHKHFRGYFFAEKAFRWPVPDRPGLIRSMVLGNVGFALWLAALGAWLGPWKIVTLFLPALCVGAGIGGLLFWIQHNFERTFFAWDEQWDFTRAGVQGSSYLWLPPLLTWFTGHIGLHHVHHVNVRIPNYRLEAARRGIPELAAVAPLSWREVRGCFSHLFWDEEGQRLVTLETVMEQPQP
jgi:omega-6 fatty acid desaturase (delta-12 desaturase)